MLLFCGCEETLPPRNDPTNFFTTSVQTVYKYNEPKENSMYVYIIIKNNYDETLEAKAAIEGTLRIKWNPPEYDPVKFIPEKNVKLTAQHILSKNYNAATGSILFNPGDSIVFLYQWNFVTDDNTDLMYQFKSLIDRDCLVRNNMGDAVYRRITERQLFEISANIKIFTQSAILYAQPLKVSQCVGTHNYGVYDPKLHPCKPIDPNNPCSLLQSP